MNALQDPAITLIMACQALPLLQSGSVGAQQHIAHAFAFM